MSEPSLKVVVFVGVGDAELRAEIEKYPTRARASRLRTLANLGLQTIQSGTHQERAALGFIEDREASIATVPEKNNSPASAPVIEEDAASRLKNKMKQCLS